MGTAVAVLGNMDLDQWYASLYGAMAMASKLSSLVKDRVAAAKLAYHIRRLDSILANFFVEIHKAMEKGMPRGLDVHREKIAEACQTLRKLHDILGNFHEACRHARLTNNSLTSGTLRSINSYNNEVLELAEILELGTQFKAIDSIYNRAQKAMERGELHDLSEA